VLVREVAHAMVTELELRTVTVTLEISAAFVVKLASVPLIISDGSDNDTDLTL
jgi:hypothetical protein